MPSKAATIPPFYDAIGREIKTGDWVVCFTRKFGSPIFLTHGIELRTVPTLVSFKARLIHGPTKYPHKQLWIGRHKFNSQQLLKVEKEWTKEAIHLHIKVTLPEAIIPEKLL